MLLWAPGQESSVGRLDGHSPGEAVFCVEYLGDDRLASGSADWKIKIWTFEDVALDRPVVAHCSLTLVGHTDSVVALRRFSGTRLASGSWDYSVRMWDTTTGKLVQKFEAHTSYVHCLERLDANRLVSASADHDLRVWHVHGRPGFETTDTLRNHTGWVLVVCRLSANLIASGSRDNSVKIWRTTVGSCGLFKTLSGHTGYVSCVEAVDAERLVTASSDSTIVLWEWTSGVRLRTWRASTSNQVVLLSVLLVEDEKLVSLGSDGAIKLWLLGDQYADRPCAELASDVKFPQVSVPSRFSWLLGSSSYYGSRLVSKLFFKSTLEHG